MKAHLCECCTKPKPRIEESFSPGLSFARFKRPRISYECETCWWCPSCGRDFEKEQLCDCIPCPKCNLPADWACIYPGLPVAARVLASAVPVCMLCGDPVAPGEWCLCPLMPF